MRSGKRPVNPALLEEAIIVIRKRFSDDCIITSSDLLSEDERRNVIGRIFLHSPSGAAPASVILKQSLPVKSEQLNDKKTEEENTRTFERFSRDWAGLEFATSLKQGIHNVPLFYDASRDHRFILIEDLGDPHVSLVDSLIAPNSGNAISALERYMKALGSFHAAGYQHTDEYEGVLRGINPKAETTRDELAKISADLPSRLSEVLAQDKLVMSISDKCKSEIQDVLNGMLSPGSFTVLTHGDIAPDNVFDHQDERGLQLIDFEHCAVRNALLDGVYLRMSIPTGWCAKAIPGEIIAHAEQIYRNELCKTMPDAKDDKLYHLAYTQACAFHVLMQLTTINSCLHENEIWRGPVIEGSLWNAKTNFMRPRYLSRLQTLIEVATTNNLYPELTAMATEVLNKVKELWPDARPLDMYPAFNSVSLQADATASTRDIEKRLSLTKNTVKLDQAREPQQQQVAKTSEAEQRQEERNQTAAPVDVAQLSTEPNSPSQHVVVNPSNKR